MELASCCHSCFSHCVIAVFIWRCVCQFSVAHFVNSPQRDRVPGSAGRVAAEASGAGRTGRVQCTGGGLQEHEHLGEKRSQEAIGECFWGLVM